VLPASILQYTAAGREVQVKHFSLIFLGDGKQNKVIIQGFVNRILFCVSFIVLSSQNAKHRKAFNFLIGIFSDHQRSYVMDTGQMNAISTA